jgi:hypothetical protein
MDGIIAQGSEEEDGSKGASTELSPFRYVGLFADAALVNAPHAQPQNKSHV